MAKILCDYKRKYHIVPHIMAKYFEGVEVERSVSKTKEGFCNYESIQAFLTDIPGWKWEKNMPYLANWRIAMTYPELQNLLAQIEKSDTELEEKEKMLLFYLLYSDNIFSNLFRTRKTSVYPKIDGIYKDMLKKQEYEIKEFEKLRKLEVKMSDQASFDIGLPEGFDVTTRFPPEPSGYLHIGHAKAALLNQYFAEKYKGSLIVRMDDTNPTNEKEEFENTIIEDLALLGITNYKRTRTSSHFPVLLKYAEKLIQKGLAYCDDTPVEEMREKRDKGVATERRSTEPFGNLEIFAKMQKGPECDAFCLRAKISVDSLNKAMRDPVIYRVNTTPHHHTGKKYRVYPTYDFACPVVDSIEGVTLALRTNEYRDRNSQYMWFISALELENRPVIWDFSRVNFRRTLLSKRKLRWFVENKKVSGWDDPRMPTVKGLIRKGLAKEALKAYIISQGPSKNTVLLSWDKLWAMNAQYLDGVANRIHGVEKADAVEFRISGIPEMQIVKIQEKNEYRLLTQRVFISMKDAPGINVSDEIVLMDIGYFKVSSMSPPTLVQSSAPPKYAKYKVTWVPAIKNVSGTAVEYRDLITVDKPDNEEPEEIFNNNSTDQEEFLLDERARFIQPGSFIQMVKRGFYYCDAASPLILNLVPETYQIRKKTG